MSNSEFDWDQEEESPAPEMSGFDEPPSPAPYPEPEPAANPYTSSDEHLWDELRRIDQLVRAQTVRWRLTIGETKPDHLWGMVHVTDAEVEAYLRSPFRLPDELPVDLHQALADYWGAAHARTQDIQARLAQTPDGDKARLRLHRLKQLFHLSDLQKDVLLVCLLPELDGRYRRLFGYLQDDASRTLPTVELVLQILHPVARRAATGWSAFDVEGPLLAHSLLALERERQGDDSFAMRSILLDNRIAAYLLGGDTPDKRLSALITKPDQAVDWNQLIVDPWFCRRLKRLAGWWRQRRHHPGMGATLFLHGPFGGGRLKIARAITTATDTSLLVVDVGKALQAGAGWERTVDLIYREAALQNAALYWTKCEVLLDEVQQAPSSATPAWARWDHLVAAAEGFAGLTFLASQTAWDPAGQFRDQSFLRLNVPMPDFKLRRHLWEAYLPPTEDFAAPAPDRALLARLLANSFQLSEGQIIDAVTSARAQATQRSPSGPRLTVEDLHAGSRIQSGRRLITMARRIEPRKELAFEDLILPAANLRQLDELRNRINHRSDVYSGLGFERRLSLGKGLIALFTGSSGTGKTMGAELLAGEQGVDLYKVDLSAVVSKYVGETEKNLSRVFAEAEDANAIIFFDEADALFGKRGEVKEARDRWANIEINYLLQRVEEYAGVVILATNLRQNIDEAFMRRIHVIVEFPFPEAEARFKIWQGMFPSGLDRPGDADIQDLAGRFRLSGGRIKNIDIDSAFRARAAAGEGQAPRITLRHVVIATAREYQKLGKPITKREFGEEFYGWVEADIL
jgi:AAA+ superfamily predicted ATPase